VDENILFENAMDRMFQDYEGDPETYRGYCAYNKARILADVNFVQKHVAKEESILDVGGVPPVFLACLAETGYKNLSIVDPNVQKFEAFFSKSNIEAVQMDLLSANIDSSRLGNFQLVCLNEVVEHLAGNLIEALKIVSSSVEENGKLLVTTPNLRSLSGLLALCWCNSGLASKPHSTVREQYENASQDHAYFGHVREYTSREVIDLIESLGFELKDVSMQPNYLKRGRLFKIVSRLESLVPGWRLFGKYLFVKRDRAR